MGSGSAALGRRARRRREACSGGAPEIRNGRAAPSGRAVRSGTVARSARRALRGAPTFMNMTFRGWRQFARDVVHARGVGLAPRVALFYARACRIARQLPDEFTLVAMTRADDLARLLELARGSRRVVEVGTGSGTTSIALALADPDRLVW